jgi:hypothetical protein
VPAEAVLGLDQHHLRAGLCGSKRRRHSRRTSTRHDNVGVGVALVEVARGRLVGDFSSRGELLEHRFISGPQSLRLDEGLVIEARRQKARRGPVGGFQIEAQGGPHVLGIDDHPILDQTMGGAHIGLVTHLHQAAGI